MKRRMNFILVMILAVLFAVVCVLIRGPKTIVVTTAAPVNLVTVAAAPPVIQPLPLTAQSPATPAEAPQAPPATAPSNVAVTEYKAVDGDTLANVTAALLGSDTKAHRDVVIAANVSLQSDPDRVLAGKTYFLVAPEVIAAPTPPADAPAAVLPSTVVPAEIIPATEPVAAQEAHPQTDRVLRYTAQPGDSVSVLAAGLLGENSQTNRDAIIAQNQSLQTNPDRVVAGKTYEIPTTDGLSAAPAAAAAASPTTQPDADQVVRINASRELRYTAVAGDSVSKLAVILLGSDTQANRDAIINNNVSLKSDPDRVIAGQTYWIPAPAAAVK